MGRLHQPIRLAWRDAFRTFDWMGIYSNAEFHIENMSKLLALADDVAVA
jgi:hypothetical protein